MPESLQFCLPEQVGVSSRWVQNYVEKMERRGMLCHSFLMMRHGKVFAEGYWKPFKQDELHRMYSVSKSFVSAAIGLLCDEGKIALTDKVADYFPDKVTPQTHPYILDTTIRDLLMMASPQATGATYTDDRTDWAKTFFNPQVPADHPAGTFFNYDTAGTYILDVLVERVTGKPFLEYLKDKMLRQLGFSENAWCVQAPEGNTWGGSGVQCSTRDLARFAQVFLNGGAVNGTQYISREYVQAATSWQIDNAPTGHRDYMHGNGYGYQIWMTHDDSFSFCGMGGQLAVCIPKYDFLFVCTSDMQGAPTAYVSVYETLWSEVIEHLCEDELPSDPEGLQALQHKLAGLSCVVPQGDADSPLAKEIAGVPYALAPNPMGISAFTVELDGDEGVLHYTTDRGEKQFRFGMGKYVLDVFPEPQYYGKKIGTPKGSGYRCMSAGVWTQPHKLVLRTYLIDDYFGNFTATFSFKGSQVGVCMQKTAEWFLDEYNGFAGGERRE